MSIKSGNPLEGKRIETWSFDKVEAGTKFTAWKAGPTLWARVHHMGQSKPCLAYYTDGEVVCPGCTLKRRLEWLGYLPLYNESHKGLVVGVKDYSAEIVDAIPPLAAVHVSRTKADKAPVVVLPLKGIESLKTKRKGMEGDAQLGDWLVHHLWKMPALIEWVERRDAAQPREVKPDAVIPAAIESDPAIAELRAAMAGQRRTGQLSTPEAVLLAQELGTGDVPLVNRVEPKRNGFHKPKPR